MFLARAEESKALYLAHKGQSVDDWKLWEHTIVEDSAASLALRRYVWASRQLGLLPHPSRHLPHCHRGQSSRHPLPSNPDIRLCDSRLSSQHWLGFSTALGLPGHLEYPPSTVWGALQKGQRIALQQEQYLSLGVDAHGRAPQLAMFVPTKMDSVSASMGMSAKNILPWMPPSSLPRVGRRVFGLSLCPGRRDRVPQSRG
jgi:hypothetical protein